jgi:ribosomal protein L19
MCTSCGCSAGSQAAFATGRHPLRTLWSTASAFTAVTLQVVPEADRKLYTYKGVCIARANKGPRSWFKVYNVFPDVGGFVQHFPL